MLSSFAFDGYNVKTFSNEQESSGSVADTEQIRLSKISALPENHALHKGECKSRRLLIRALQDHFEKDWQVEERAYLQYNELRIAEAFKKGAHQKLVVVCNPVVSEILPLALHWLWNLVFLVVQVADAINVQALRKLCHSWVRNWAILRNVQREFLPAIQVCCSSGKTLFGLEIFEEAL